MTDDHKEIWLEPTCKDCVNGERSWCEDNVWDEGCPDCHAMPVRYVLAPPLPSKDRGGVK